MLQRNPFIINSKYVSDEYFCDRETETKELIDNILNGRNTAIISPRRMGKSGLVQRVFAQKEIARDFVTITSDILSTETPAEFINILSYDVYKTIAPHKKILHDFFSALQSLRPAFRLNPNTGEIEFSLELGQISQPDKTLDEIFAFLESREVPSIIAIDEFQAIAKYEKKNFAALLRSHVQKCKQTIFIFSGSSHNMMDKIFNNPSEPFFGSVRIIYLDPIDKEKYRNFAQNLFKKGGKEMPDEAFSQIYDKFQGHTWYVQHVLNQLYGDLGVHQTATPIDIGNALNHILRFYDKTFRENVSKYTIKQKALLIAIAKEGTVPEITSSDFVNRHALGSASSVQGALRPLIKNELVLRDSEGTHIANRFFSLWLNDNF
ncbi:MAG: ATPase [Bacteroidales bacterium]|nr:ATPase [Bacteroidales bacterium]